MDLKQLEYIVAIEKYGNVTKAAEKLYITPSALNQQLSKLEKELGQPLFIRDHRQLSPTHAGQIYLQAARQMLELKSITYSKLSDLLDCQTGIYHIGLTFDQGNNIFSRVYPEFHRIFPGIELRCYQILVPEMHRMLVHHQLDLALILTGSPEEYTDVEYLHFSTENLLLGLPVSHPLASRMNPQASPYCTIDLSLLKEESIATALNHSTMRTELIDPMFEAAGFTPHIIMESSLNHYLESLCVQGVCACIIPQSQVTNKKDIVWFYLPGAPRFDFGAAFPKGAYLNKALSTFVSLGQKIAQAELNYPSPEDLEIHK